MSHFKCSFTLKEITALFVAVFLLSLCSKNEHKHQAFTRTFHPRGKLDQQNGFFLNILFFTFFLMLEDSQNPDNYVFSHGTST